MLQVLSAKVLPQISRGIFARAMCSKVGKQIPHLDVFEKSPMNTVNLGEWCSGRKVLIFGLPGAFTPGCSQTHLPGYVQNFEQFKEKGIDEIACIAVNDPFVMTAWGNHHSCKDKVRMFADTHAQFTKAIGMDFNLEVLGGIRSKRYSMIVDDTVITHFNAEPNGTELGCSLAEKALPLL